MTDSEVREAIELGIDNYAAAQFAYMTGRDADPKFREQAREQAIALIEAYGAWREAEGAWSVWREQRCERLSKTGTCIDKKFMAICQVCRDRPKAEAERDRRADALAQLIGG